MVHPLEPEQRWPDFFDCLAVMGRLVRVEVRSPEFHAKYPSAIDMAGGFITFVADCGDGLDAILSDDGVPLEETARRLRGIWPGLGIDEGTDALIGSMVDAAMGGLAPIARDPDLPAYLEECRRVIELG